MKLQYATFLLNKNRDDYNRMAASYDSKRGFIPKDFLYIQKFINPNEKVLDLGCGNGRLAKLINSNSYLGIDISEEAIKIAKNNNPGYGFDVLSDPLKFPFDNNVFDRIFCLSTFHHIPSKIFRMAFLLEAKRILKAEGNLVLTVWNLKTDKKANKLLWKNRFQKFILQSKLDFNDIFYPWRDSDRNILAERYVHIFSLRELKKLLGSIGFTIIEEKIIDRSEKGSNTLIVAQKHS